MVWAWCRHSMASFHCCCSVYSVPHRCALYACASSLQRASHRGDAVQRAASPCACLTAFLSRAKRWKRLRGSVLAS
uniref:Uncharacterized protein n=1 Tax=Ixodes ricinus TaxID=34613 RepID=A0A6B0U2I7_IXORI